ncbi:MAG: hypothetical protein MUF64_23980 [Polyangiaceae bacterium]|jgi:hypothetical protein|nr:hypothetical protein [Polyangiaceae bacterium]
MRLSALSLVLLLAACQPSSPPPKPPPSKNSAKPLRTPPPRPVAAPIAGGSSDGMSCEQVIEQNNDELTLGKKQEADLSTAELSAVLNNGSYLNECEVPASTKVSVCAAVKEGRALGVTVAMSPGDPEQERCVAGKVRSLGYPIHKKLHVARTSFE